jgi:hypothetical protein
MSAPTRQRPPDFADAVDAQIDAAFEDYASQLAAQGARREQWFGLAGVVVLAVTLSFVTSSLQYTSAERRFAFDDSQPIIVSSSRYPTTGAMNPSAPSPAPVNPQGRVQQSSQPPLARVVVGPIIGAPDAIAKQIQQQFVGAVEKRHVSVISGKAERADYTLRGYIVAARDKLATTVSYIWHVTDPTSKRVNRITGEEIVSNNTGSDPWGGFEAAGHAIDRR